MLAISQLRPGNWLFDLQQGCYCSVVEVKQGVVIVNSFSNPRYQPLISQLGGIKIISDNLTLGGFAPGAGNFYECKVDDKYIVIVPGGTYDYKWLVDGKLLTEVYYIHEWQNAFEDCTGKKLDINLYGAKQ